MPKSNHRIAQQFIHAVRINRVPVSTSVLNDFRRDLRRLAVYE